MLIQPYGTYVGLYAPFIEKQIPLSYIMDTLSKELMTDVWVSVAHFVIEYGLY